MEALRRDFLPEHLKPVVEAAGIGGTVVVQAQQTLAETKWLLAEASRHELIRGVVGWAPLASPDVGRILEEYAEDPRLKAVRHVIQDEPDDRFILRDDFNRGIRRLKSFGLRYDILVVERQLPETIRFVDSHPDQIFIVDHLAKPRIRDRVLDPWRRDIQELARREHVYCKISGMVTEADWGEWTPEDLKPYFETVLEAFGPQRLMFGSDWPVLLLAADYGTWVEVMSEMIAPLSSTEQTYIMGRTAIEAYGLEP